MVICVLRQSEPRGARPYFSGLAGTGNFGAERSMMIGKFADPGVDLMPWVAIADSDLHGNDPHRPANEKEEGCISISNLTLVLAR